MAQELTGPEPSRVPLFNGSLETGMRAVVMLDAVFPRAFDLSHLIWLDHLVVHTADIGGPESLHPDIPQRIGELLVRRRLVENGLTLMRQLHLVDAQNRADGILYVAREEASAFVDSLRTAYGRALKERAGWLADYVNQRADSELAELIANRIGRWSVEFQGESDAPGGGS
ncbi:ABC-three component system middle component 2 [Mesorhizobium sp. M0145]|uniref:ABC-three component system middle component 2 n=1 Tax=unclassified Mesorhizobium TaxID=325217 RepID=UPI0033377114